MPRLQFIHANDLIRCYVAMLCCLVATSVGWAQTDSGEQARETNTAAAEQNAAIEQSLPTGEIILVVGAAGTEQYGEQFQQWATQWQQVAEASEMSINTIGLSNETKPTDRERLQATLQQARTSAAEAASQPLWIVLIGHGTFARNVAKFNLRGPDVAASELAQWLNAVQRPIVVVNTASSSGPFINQLSAENRVVVTATKSGTQQNFARFGRYFTDALASPDSDLDHDDEVSVHEAFLRASAQVKQWYDSEGRIATETALVDDNGDGKGTPATMFRGTRPAATAKDGTELDGKFAARITLVPGGNRLPLTADELKRRDKLENELEALRSRKADFDQQSYDAELQAILLQLAHIYQAAEQRARSNP